MEVVGTEICRLGFLDVPFEVDVPFVRVGDGRRLRLVSCIGGTEKGTAWYGKLKVMPLLVLM